VVDDLDAGFRPSGSGWRSADSCFRKHHYWVPVRRATVVRTAAWRVTLDAPGHYEVKVKIPRRNATTRSAAYRIRTVDGFVRRVRNQWKRRGDWVSLGIHDLAGDAVVRLTDKTGERGSSGRRVAFDAVKFIPADGPARATRTTISEGTDSAASMPRRSAGPDRTEDASAGAPSGRAQDRDAAGPPEEPVPTPAPAPAHDQATASSAPLPVPSPVPSPADAVS
jgi:hypothetical protein